MIFLWTLLTLSVLLINGRNDAVSAINASVSLRAMPKEKALRIAAISTFFGALILPFFNGRIADTFLGIADFGKDPNKAFVGLCSALGTVILWSSIAKHFKLPVNETHALLSGISGAAIATRTHVSSIHTEQWKIVLLGMLMSTLPVFLLSFCFHRILRICLSRKNRRRAVSYFLRSQRWSTVWSAALLGAQDTQKYIGVYWLGLSYVQQRELPRFRDLSFFVLFFFAAVITMGTFLPSSALLKTIGQDMAESDAPAFSAANAASSLMMTVCTLWGLPTGLLQSRICAQMGAAACQKNGLDLRVVGRIFLIWLITLPICGGMAFLFSNFGILFL